MTRSRSKNMVVKLGSNDISQYCDNSEFNRTTDLHDLTGYGKSAHVYGGGLEDGTFTCSGQYDTTASTGPRAVIEPLIGDEDGISLTRQPEGTGSGKPQDVVTIIVTGYAETAPVAGYVLWAMNAQLSDSVNSAAQAP